RHSSIISFEAKGHSQSFQCDGVTDFATGATPCRIDKRPPTTHSSDSANAQGFVGAGQLLLEPPQRPFAYFSRPVRSRTSLASSPGAGWCPSPVCLTKEHS